MVAHISRTHVQPSQLPLPKRSYLVRQAFRVLAVKRLVVLRQLGKGLHRACICICHHCLRRAKFRATLAYSLLVDAILVPVDPINGFGGRVRNANSKRCLSY